MIKVTCLGVEGYPQGGRETISILVESNEQRILLDCGASIIQQLDRCRLKANDIDSVFISHLHADHSSGLILLLYSCLMEQFEKRAFGNHSIDVVGNQSIISPLISYCKSAYPNMFSNGNPIKVNLLNTTTNAPVISKNSSFKSIPISHAVPGQSVLLTIDGVKLCYTADTRRTVLLDTLAKDSDVIICNAYDATETVSSAAGFMSPIGAAKFAQEAGASTLILLHLYEQKSRLNAFEDAKRFFDGYIFVPNNGESTSI